MTRLKAFLKEVILPLPGLVLLSAAYIFIVCPYGFLCRRFAAQDRFKPDRRRPSYWKDRTPETPSMKRARERF